ncbi:MAG: patatin-like phospholipase family protein, partial [bacterium]|nr:patatin-like phospholipase family protein [bacterium]
MENQNSKNPCKDHPVLEIDTGSAHKEVVDGIALCLSGGGYRAMLFHLGTLWRLNEFGYLPKLARISSVSGGSITAALLGLKWPKLNFDGSDVGQQFESEVVTPIRALAGKTIDVKSILKGIFTKGSVSKYVIKSYKKHLYGDSTLRDLPGD